MARLPTQALAQHWLTSLTVSRLISRDTKHGHCFPRRGRRTKKRKSPVAQANRSTLRIIFHARSIHEGKGSKTAFFRCVAWLWNNHPRTLLAK